MSEEVDMILEESTEGMQKAISHLNQEEK